MNSCNNAAHGQESRKPCAHCQAERLGRIENLLSARASSEEKLRLATDALERIAGWPGPVGTNVGSLNAAEANGLRRTIAREALARIREGTPAPP